MTSLATLQSEQELELELSDFDALDLAFEREQLGRSFYEFCKSAWHIVEPTQPFLENWHLRKLCWKLEQIAYKKGSRTIFNVPPGTAKSLVIQVLFPCWVWAKNARKRFLSVSYGQHLTLRDNLRSRQIIESEWYQKRWPVQLADDQKAKGRYNTSEHGWRIATSIDGVGTGEHPDFIIIDDPTSADEARSDAERAAANRWFDTTASTRLGRNPAIIVVMQRLHQEDLSGHLLARGGWDHVRWPMRFEKCTCDELLAEGSTEKCPLHKADPDWKPDPLDERTEAGELLFPALFPEEKVRDLEKNLGPVDGAGQLQQRPSPEGGSQFKMEWFADKYVDVAPSWLRVARGWDTAGTEGGGDYTCGVLIGEEIVNVPDAKDPRFNVPTPTGKYFVIDVKRDQLGPSGVNKLIKVTAQEDNQRFGRCAVREEKEGGSAGKTVIEARAKTLKGFDYAGVTVSGSKATRAKPFRAQCEAGNVYLVKASWNVEYLRELCAFPTGKNDDQVDGSSCSFNAVLLEEPPPQAGLTWGRRIK